MDAATGTIQTRIASGCRPGKEESMKKLFISQPMVDMTDEEIFKERETAMRSEEVLGDDIEVIDSVLHRRPNTSRIFGILTGKII